MSTSFTIKTPCYTSSFVTCLTFGFFRFGFDDTFRLFPAVDTEAEVDTLEVVIPLLEPSNTQLQWKKLQRSPLHKTCVVMHYDVERLHSCSEN